jgi:hypothetical protein
VKDLDIACLRIEVVTDLDVSIACEELDELKRAFLEVSLRKFSETLVSPMIFLRPVRPITLLGGKLLSNTAANVKGRILTLSRRRLDVQSDR